MRPPASLCRSLALACTAVFASASAAQAQTSYGVNASGTLSSFDVNGSGTINTIIALPFRPEVIDFRPGTSTLYATDVTADTTQLYRIGHLGGRRHARRRHLPLQGD
jgi:hypothetical protein